MGSRAGELLALGESTEAYNHYREAAAISQKVVQLLKVKRTFAIDILPQEQQSAEGANEVVPGEGRQNANLASEGRAVLEEVRNALLRTPLDAEVSTRLNEYIKGAEASLLRGDIAQNLGDLGVAHTHYTNALRVLDMASEVLAEGAPTPLPQEERVPEAGKPFEVLHTHVEAGEVYTGGIDIRGCETVTAYVTEYAARAGTGTSLALVVQRGNLVPCNNAVQKVQFVATTSSPVSPTEVTVQGEPVPFVLTHAPTASPSAAEPATESLFQVTNSVMGQVLEVTQGLLTQ
jgi:hypothetical protein